MNHKTAWERLPDLLHERPEGELHAHLGVCHACQQQLFRLARVDALLRHHQWSQQRRRRRPRRRLLAAVCAASVTAAIVAVTGVVLVSAGHPSGARFVLRAASGEIVGRGGIERADADNQLISLDARGLPRRLGDMYLLWMSTGAEGRRLVGRFMVDRTGSCHVLFSLPVSERVERLWVAPQESPDATTAST